MQTLKNILGKMTGVRKSELETYWDNIDGPAERQITAVVVGCGQRHGHGQKGVSIGGARACFPTWEGVVCARPKLSMVCPHLL